MELKPKKWSYELVHKCQVRYPLDSVTAISRVTLQTQFSKAVGAKDRKGVRLKNYGCEGKELIQQQEWNMGSVEGISH